MTNEPDPLLTEIAEKLDRFTKIGQKILAPFLYVSCFALGALATFDNGGWAIGAMIGFVVAWVLVRLSYYPIRWALIVLGIAGVAEVL